MRRRKIVAAAVAEGLAGRVVAEGVAVLQVRLDRWVPSDASKGQEGVSVQGLALILLLGGVAVSAWRGFERILDGHHFSSGEQGRT